MGTALPDSVQIAGLAFPLVVCVSTLIRWGEGGGGCVPIDPG